MAELYCFVLTFLKTESHNVFSSKRSTHAYGIFFFDDHAKTSIMSLDLKQIWPMAGCLWKSSNVEEIAIHFSKHRP